VVTPGLLLASALVVVVAASGLAAPGVSLSGFVTSRARPRNYIPEGLILFLPGCYLLSRVSAQQKLKVSMVLVFLGYLEASTFQTSIHIITSGVILFP
jgi:hypothetical protein